MNGNTKKWIFRVSVGVGIVVITGIGSLWVGHFITSNATAQTAQETKEIVAPLQEAVLLLTEIHKAEDATIKRDAELCNAGIITECEICARAGVTLSACVEKVN